MIKNKQLILEFILIILILIDCYSIFLSFQKQNQVDNQKAKDSSDKSREEQVFACSIDFETCNATIKPKDYYKWSGQEKLKYFITLGNIIPFEYEIFCGKNRNLKIDNQGNIPLDAKDCKKL